MNSRFLTLLFVASALFISSATLAPSMARAAGPAVTPMAQITPADEGRQVTVQGTVVETENFSTGFRLFLNDSTAQVVLLIWADDWDHLYNSYHLNVGAVVRVSGKVEVYKNQVEIVPRRGSDVEVVKWARRDWRKYDLGRMNGNDHNAVVWVEGTIADITRFTDGAYMLIYDGTGAQKVKLYDVVAGRIPQREKLWVGQKVSVVGRVRARRRVGVEIIVALPHDVYVLGSDGSGKADVRNTD